MENLSEHLKENVTYINGLFENAMDYIEREFMVGTVPAALLTMDGLVSKQHITLSILNPLMRAKIPTDNGKETLLFIEENVLCAVEQAELSTVSEVLERMMNETKRFYKKPAVTKDGITYFRGYYRFFRGVMKFNIPRNESMDKFLTEKGFINRKEFI